MADFSFTPATVTIAPGDTVRWQWASGSHTTTRDGAWDAPITLASPAYERQFPTAGTFAYYCKPHAGSMTGQVVVQSSEPVNVAPTASFTFSPAQPVPGQTVTFDGSASSDADGTVQSWRWDLDGDGTYETVTPTAMTSRSYDAPGTRTVRLYVIDNDGAQSAPATRTFTVASAPGGGSDPPSGTDGGTDGGTEQPPDPSTDTQGSTGDETHDGLEPEPLGREMPSESEPPPPTLSGPRTTGAVRPSAKGVVTVPRLRASCPAGGSACTLAITLRATPRGKRARAIGTARQSLAAGRTSKVALRLSRAGRRLLGRERKLRAEVIVRLTSFGAPPAVKRTTFRLVQPR